MSENNDREICIEKNAYQISFGKHLRDLIQRAEISQREFAKILDVRPNTVNGWANGSSMPNWLQLRGIIKYFCQNPKTTDFNPMRLIYVDLELENTIATMTENYRKKVDELGSEVVRLRQENKKLEARLKNEPPKGKLRTAYKELKTEQERFVLNFRTVCGFNPNDYKQAEPLATALILPIKRKGPWGSEFTAGENKSLGIDRGKKLLSPEFLNLIARSYRAVFSEKKPILKASESEQEKFALELGHDLLKIISGIAHYSNQKKDNS